MLDAFKKDTRIQMWVTSDSGDQTPTAASVAVNALTYASGDEPFTAMFDTLEALLKVQHQVDHPNQIPDYDYVRLLSDVRREFFPKLAPAGRYERWIGHTIDDVLQADTGQ
ncbi:hypothetical protein HQO84_00385 [Rhodococcus fascians]|nr:hypothetical protein [Rhodococcus fascians]MBY3999150.1 hypothetical protein [Rhodococcus fascians]MBY4000226.1 hypothetical protein [Rhodococcus fascians]MBY4005254.1 hypothetical protein [Rhodococcus fascians]MBY4016904.1 hypothetical protein [Rhodococcus fascians]